MHVDFTLNALQVSLSACTVLSVNLCKYCASVSAYLLLGDYFLSFILIRNQFPSFP